MVNITPAAFQGYCTMRCIAKKGPRRNGQFQDTVVFTARSLFRKQTPFHLVQLLSSAADNLGFPGYRIASVICRLMNGLSAFGELLVPGKLLRTARSNSGECCVSSI
jgi:hypothetical protein